MGLCPLGVGCAGVRRSSFESRSLNGRRRTATTADSQSFKNAFLEENVTEGVLAAADYTRNAFAARVQARYFSAGTLISPRNCQFAV